MQCEQCRNQLTSRVVDHLDETQLQAIMDHLKHCEPCQTYAEELRLRRLLSTLPAPRPRESFVSSAVDNALRHKTREQEPARGHWFHWPMATAACVALLVFMVIQLKFVQRQPEPQPLAATTPPAASAVQPVAVWFNAPRDIDEALITVHLGQHIRLQRYTQEQPLRWKTRLTAGGNKLTLPVQLTGSRTGEVIVELQYEDFHKALRIPVTLNDKHPEDGHPVRNINPETKLL